MQRRGDRVTKKNVDQKKKQRQRERIAAKQKKQKQVRMMMIGTIVVVILAVGAVALYYANSDSDSDGQAASGDNQTEKADFSYKDQPMMGDKDAPVKITEFGDFKCPGCGNFARNVFPQVKKALIDTGDASFYFMNYPVIDGSLNAANAGEAIHKQGNDKFWKFYDALYDNQGDENEDWATPKFLIKLAKKNVPDIDTDQLKKDVDQQNYMDQIKADTQEGVDAGVTGTPTLYVNGEKLEHTDLASIKKAVKKAKNNG